MTSRRHVAVIPGHGTVEVTPLKKLLAEAELDQSMLKELAEGNV